MSFINSKVITNKHDACECIIMKRMHKGRLHPVPGLYCSNHGSLIRWLTDDHYKELIEMGVEEISMLPDDEQTYNRRLRLLNDNKPEIFDNSWIRGN